MSSADADQGTDDRLTMFVRRIDELDPATGTKPLAHEILAAFGIPAPARVMDIRHRLSGESDRGCVVLASSYLDEQLARLLREVLVDDESVADQLLDDRGALATFSARIDMTYMLGYLPNEQRKALHIVRKVRNDFAHDVDANFDTPSIRDRCLGLPQPPLGRTKGPRDRFVTNVFILLAVIHGERARAHHAALASVIGPVPNASRLNEVFEKLLSALFGDGASSNGGNSSEQAPDNGNVVPPTSVELTTEKGQEDDEGKG
jgi:hypothetical protein